MSRKSRALITILLLGFARIACAGDGKPAASSSIVTVGVALSQSRLDCGNEDQNQLLATWNEKLGRSELRVPDFTLKALDGPQKSLSDFDGQVTLIIFWDYFCPGCQNELSELAKIQSKYKQKEFRIIAINTDRLDEIEPNAPKRFYKLQYLLLDRIKTMQLPFEVLLGPGSLGGKYPGCASPFTVLVDRSRFIRHFFFGFNERDMLTIEKVIRQLLRK